MSALAVLYIDDEPDIREVAAMALGLDRGLAVRTAESCVAALVLLEDGAWSPDVILLDVMMPGLDGPGTLARLRTLPGHGRTPVVFITARAQAQEKARLIGLGAVGVISKPFEPMSLAAELRAILDAAPAPTPAPAAPHPDAGDGLDELRSRFLTRCAADLATLRDAGARPDQIRFVVHRLAGAAGTFGYGALGEAAAGLDLALQAGADPQGAEAQAMTATLVELLESLTSPGPGPMDPAAALL